MKAIDFFRAASQSGKCAKALYNLGICYELGSQEFNERNGIQVSPTDNKSIVIKDMDRAASLYLESSKLDFIPGMVSLAVLIFRCAKNGKNLVYNNQPKQQSSLVNLDDENLFGEDLEDAYFDAGSYLRLALSMDEGHPEANYWMGVLYEEGLGVEINHEISWKYYERSAQAGFMRAFTKLGHYCYSGVRRQEFMKDDGSEWSLSRNDDYIFAKKPDKMEAV